MPEDKPFLRLLKRNLNEGKAEVISLAVEKQAELVLLDEFEARRIAELFGLIKN